MYDVWFWKIEWFILFYCVEESKTLVISITSKAKLQYYIECTNFVSSRNILSNKICRSKNQFFRNVGRKSYSLHWNFLRTQWTTLFNSSMLLWSAPSRNNGGKNSHAAVDITIATVMGPDMAQCTLHLWPNNFIKPTSTTTHTPCSTKKQVTSHVGVARVTW
jgi:hypothetical protein